MCCGQSAATSKIISILRVMMQVSNALSISQLCSSSDCCHNVFKIYKTADNFLLFKLHDNQCYALVFSGNGAR